MGLYQYAFAFEPDEVELPNTLKLKSPFQYPFAEWSKHTQLYEWMRSLYELKGGNGEFNGDFLNLTEADLQALEKATDDLNFYQQYKADEYWIKRHQEEDKNFIQDALNLIEQGCVIFYCASS